MHTEKKMHTETETTRNRVMCGQYSRCQASRWSRSVVYWSMLSILLCSFFCRDGSIPSAYAAGTLSTPTYQKPRVVVWKLTGDAGLADVATSGLTQALGKNKNIRTSSYQEMQKVLQIAAERALMGSDDMNDAVRVVNELTDVYVVVGSVQKKDGLLLAQIQLTLTTVTPADGNKTAKATLDTPEIMIWRDEVSADSEKALREQMGLVAAKISNQILENPEDSLDEAAQKLAKRLATQLLCRAQPKQRDLAGATVVMAPMRRADAPFSSAFADSMVQRLQISAPATLSCDEKQRNIAWALHRDVIDEKNTHKTTRATVWMSSSYRREGDMIYVASALYAQPPDSEQNRDIQPMAFDQIRLVADAVPPHLPIDAENADAALQDQKLIDAGQKGRGDLHVSFWTQRGNTGAVFFEGEEIVLRFRANKPCEVRVIYHLAGGEHILLEKTKKVEQSDVNRTIELDRYEIAAPFGIERIQLVASTDGLPPLNTVVKEIDGVAYDVIPDLTAAMEQLRGIKKKNVHMNEAVITLTTLPKETTQSADILKSSTSP